VPDEVQAPRVLCIWVILWEVRPKVTISDRASKPHQPARGSARLRPDWVSNPAARGHVNAAEHQGVTLDRPVHVVSRSDPEPHPHHSTVNRAPPRVTSCFDR
jgi:hypothetical protein